MALTLAEVETAIQTIQTGGQSWTAGDMSGTAASLPALVALRDQLKQETARSSGTRPTFRAFNFGSMAYGETE